MGAWIISITGVICLGILLDIVLPDGKTTKYIRGAFSLIVILVIVSPLPSLMKKEWNFSFDDSAFSASEIDEESVVSDMFSYSAEKCEEELKRQGITASVEIEYSSAVVRSVTVSVDDVSVSGEKVVSIVSEILGIAAYKIKVLYGQNQFCDSL